MNRNKCRLLLQVINQNDEKKVALAKDYKRKVEEELTELCETVLMLLNDYLIPNATEIESQVQWILLLVLSTRLIHMFCSSRELSLLFVLPW